MEKIELDAYVHCRECVMESGDEPYTQHIEVGVINQNTLVVNCNIHDELIGSFSLEQTIDDSCSCCEEENNNA
jgi:hypothetical protein